MGAKHEIAQALTRPELVAGIYQSGWTPDFTTGEMILKNAMGECGYDNTWRAGTFDCIWQSLPLNVLRVYHRRATAFALEMQTIAKDVTPTD